MAPQQQQGQGDNSLSVVWIIVATGLGVYFLWVVFQQYIVAFVFKIKLFETFVIDFFTANEFYASTVQPIQTQIYAMSTNLKGVSFDEVMLVSAEVGRIISWPIAAILTGLAAYLYFANPTLKYKKTYDMKRLLQEERVNWPQTNPVLNLDLAKEDIHKGPWAMAEQPLEFAKKKNLLEIKERELEGTGQRVTEYHIRKGAANQVFSMQLGRTWQGIEHLPIHAQALFGVFALRAHHDKKPAEAMLDQIARSADSGKLNFKNATELAMQFNDSKLLRSLTRRHAYEYTVFATLLTLARTDGVLASADFLWLRPLDRTLWYVLNTIGRQTPFTEVAGIFAHWKAELDLGRKVYVPMVEQASDALEIAVKEVKYIPEDE